MKKAYLILLMLFLVLGLSACGRTSNKDIITDLQNPDQEQVGLEKTLDLSREYASLRYQTDNVLINAAGYADYDSWNSDMSAIVVGWGNFEKSASELEKLAEEMAQEKVSFKLIESAQAYTKEEVTSVIDKAPLGKKIMTLAKHLGVDAKMAQLILNETQNMISREAYGEEGDVFQTCENQVIVVKNTAKVTVFVGTIALTGGTAAIASGGTLAQAAVVVSGADLTLEITDDAAKMALGDKNKISSVVGDVRKITEPAAAILMVSTLPNNLVKGIDKLNAAVFGADQLNGTIQSGSVIGIKLSAPIQEKSEPSTEVSVLEKEEVETWMKEQGVVGEVGTVEDVEKILRAKQVESQESDLEKTNQVEVENKNEETQVKSARIGAAEYNELSDQGKFSTMKQVKEFFGEPDFSTTNEAGRIVYIYLNSIGKSEGLRFTFYTLEDYKKTAESAFGWDEDYQDIWDASEGGLVASSELRDSDSLKSAYGF